MASIGSIAREGAGIKGEGKVPSADLGKAIEIVQPFGPEPDEQALADEKRLMAQPMTADISGDLEGAAKAVVFTFRRVSGPRGNTASCGCARHACCEEGRRLSRKSQDAYRTPDYDAITAEYVEHVRAAQAEIEGAE